MCFYKFRRLTIGQNRSTVCVNEGGHRDAFLNDCSEHAFSSSCIAYWPYYFMIEYTLPTIPTLPLMVNR